LQLAMWLGRKCRGGSRSPDKVDPPRFRKLSTASSFFWRQARTQDTDMSARINELMALREPGQPLAGLSDFAKEYGDEAFCRRLLTKYGDDMRKCTEKYKSSLRWRDSRRELIISRRFALGGDIRVIGADLARRPVVYLCMKNQMLPGTQCLDQMLVGMLRAVDNMPTGVQTATHIWDLHGMSMRMNLNPAPLGHMLQVAEGYFVERMHRLIIVEMPRLAGCLKDAVWPLVPEKTKDKIKFMTADEAKQYLRNECSTDVSERIEGVMEQNRDRNLTLQQRMVSWTRVDELGNLVPALA